MHPFFIFLIILFIIYLLVGKVIPFFVFPNYFLKADIESYAKIKQIANKVKGKNKQATLNNTYKYIKSIMIGHPKEFIPKNAITLLEIGRFPTNNVLKISNKNNITFQWCHTQNRIIKSILIHTGQFSEDDMKIRWNIINDPFIHQYLEVNTSNNKSTNKNSESKTYVVDPFYNIFEEIKK